MKTYTRTTEIHGRLENDGEAGWDIDLRSLPDFAPPEALGPPPVWGEPQPRAPTGRWRIVVDFTPDGLETLDPIQLVQARNYTRVPEPTRRIDLIVIHTMEAAEKPTTAEAVAAWFAGPSAPRASAHYCIDADSIVQCVNLRDVAWHAPGANANGIGLEHAGFARQTPEEWSDDYSRRMLQRSAALSALLCRVYGIPATYVGADVLKRQKPHEPARGITTHADVSKAFQKSTHTDPGKGFPMVDYVEMVRAAMRR